jgi:predicted nucleic acid-binding protein
MKLITTTKNSVDSNILVYLHDKNNPDQRTIARSLVKDPVVVSAQAVSEYMNVTRRLLKNHAKAVLVEMSIRTLISCQIQPVSILTLFYAQKLIRKSDFQMFDAIIIASALEAGCTMLYSEDMEHDRLVEDQLRIINPFLTLKTKK